MHGAEAQDATPRSTVLTCYLLLWLAGLCLRLTVLVVPPLVPQLHADLHLSQTEIGVLSGLPSLLLALAAIPGALLVARFGAVPTLVLGLLVCAAGSAARGLANHIWPLYAATILMAAGIAVMQPVLPQLVRSWHPRRIGFATAVSMSGLIVGEVLPVGLTLSVVLPLTGGGWRWGVAFWAIPVVAVALLVAWLAPRPPATAPPSITDFRRWWPDWRQPLLWRLGFLLGGVNSIYFATNAFLPDYLTALRRPDLIDDALIALNFSQLPASFIMLAVTGRLARRAAAYVSFATLILISAIGMITTSAPWVVFWAGMLGFANTMGLVLGFALAPLLSLPNEVHRTSAGMFTISYTTAMITPVIGGALWDLSGLAWTAFLPIIVWPIAIALLALTIDFRGAPGGEAGR